VQSLTQHSHYITTFFNQNKQFMQRILLLFTLLLIGISTQAQVTTSSLAGKVSGEGDEEMIAVNVKAVHEPSGTVYGTTTLDNGRFNIPNMRVGGPYTVTVSYLGYQDFVQENIYLALGQNVNIFYDS
jgi:hypothetical protein